MRSLTVLILAALLSLSPALAKGRSSSSRATARASAASGSRAKRAKRCTACARDSHGRIARSRTARHEFQRQHPCPATGKTSGACPGYVVDHVVPLKRGGADAPSNMQWQTAAAAKAKDRVE